MLNDAAKKIVARAARTDTSGYRARVTLGAAEDALYAEAWRQALVEHPEFREWPSAEKYFEAVFYNELEGR